MIGSQDIQKVDNWVNALRGAFSSGIVERYQKRVVLRQQSNKGTWKVNSPRREFSVRDNRKVASPVKEERSVEDWYFS